MTVGKISERIIYHQNGSSGSPRHNEASTCGSNVQPDMTGWSGCRYLDLRSCFVRDFRAKRIIHMAIILK
jgi:hypothetical protein